MSAEEVKSTSADDDDDDHDNLNDCDHDYTNLDDSVWDDSDEVFNDAAELDREWQRRRDQFHTMGYRDGLIAGKEAAAQEGFNIGFKQSVLHGNRWGLVRGVPVEAKEKREEFQGLYESVQSLSTIDALRLFNDDIKAKEALEQSEHVEGTSNRAESKDKTSHDSLGSYIGKFESLIKDSPAIDIQIPESK
ncbi:Essential protein Yae1, N-terminal [Trifolium repens]|nr:Essential protein Yae1, N-terminal [Trifolium repens]